MTSKAELLKKIRAGADEREVVECPDPVGDRTIRPLRQGEVDTYNAMLLRGQSVETSGDPRKQRGEMDARMMLDLEAITAGEAEANRHVVACALSVHGDKWMPSEAAELPIEAFGKILDKAKELTGTDAFMTIESSSIPRPGGQQDGEEKRDEPGPTEEARRFRRDDGGDADPAAGDVGDPARADAG